MPETMRVLCTGGAGFIGRFLVGALRRRGYEVWCLLGPADDPRALDGEEVRPVRGDITRPESLAPLARPFDYVYHLAGCLSSADARRLAEVNERGTANLVRLLHGSGVVPKRLVFASSIAAVGPSSWNRPHTEESACRPVSAYGRSKLRVERYLRAVAPRLPVTVIRLPMVYGPGLTRGIYVFFKCINRRVCFEFGETELTVGYMDDIVRGMIMAAENPRACGQTYFLGESKVYRGSEVMRAIETALGKKALRFNMPVPAAALAVKSLKSLLPGRRTRLAARLDELDCYLKHRSWAANVDKARNELGFEAEVPLAEGIRRTARWYLQNGYL